MMKTSGFPRLKSRARFFSLWTPKNAARTLATTCRMLGFGRSGFTTSVLHRVPPALRQGSFRNRASKVFAQTGSLST